MNIFLNNVFVRGSSLANDSAAINSFLAGALYCSKVLIVYLGFVSGVFLFSGETLSCN